MKDRVCQTQASSILSIPTQSSLQWYRGGCGVTSFAWSCRGQGLLRIAEALGTVVAPGMEMLRGKPVLRAKREGQEISG